MERRVLAFCPFTLDLLNERLSRGDRCIALRPKTFHVLRCLAEHSGQLVRTPDILSMVWPETQVTGTVLRVCIRELRQALDDQAAAPCFIENVHGRGYRFIAPVMNSTD